MKLYRMNPIIPYYGFFANTLNWPDVAAPPSVVEPHARPPGRYEHDSVPFPVVAVRGCAVHMSGMVDV